MKTRELLEELRSRIKEMLKTRSKMRIAWEVGIARNTLDSFLRDISHIPTIETLDKIEKWLKNNQG